MPWLTKKSYTHHYADGRREKRWVRHWSIGIRCRDGKTRYVRGFTDKAATAALIPKVERMYGRQMVPEVLSDLMWKLQTYEPWMRVPPCVYYLVHRAVVVYVGQSTDLNQRVAWHYGNGTRKAFDTVYFQALPLDQLNVVEPEEIRRIGPAWNKRDCGYARRECSGRAAEPPTP